MARLNLGKLGSEIPSKPIAFPNFRAVPSLNQCKSLKMERLPNPCFGTVLAMLQYVHAIITSLTALPETHTLVIVGAGLIIISLFLRRILSAVGPAGSTDVKPGEGAKQASQK
ncbi:MAG TPA: hypothetical protein VEI55_05870 [Candidatus Acidoferrum sp.]|nr:hypothetical protein [Candidatus Acidoferrum sp.]